MTLRMDSRQQLDLSGAWQIAFDPESRGLADGWATGNWPPDRASAVPTVSSWQAIISWRVKWSEGATATSP